MEHRLSNLQGVASIERVLEDYALASDVGLHFGNVTVGLGKMAANHRSKDTGIHDCEKSKPLLGRCTSAKRSYGVGRPVCVVEVEVSAPRIAMSEEGVPAMFGGLVLPDLINVFATN